MGRFKRLTERIRLGFARYKKQTISLAIAVGVIGIGSAIYATQYTYDTSVGLNPYSLSGHPTTIKYGVNPTVDGDWYYAYCINPEKKQPNYTDYTDGGPIDDTSFTILGWGYPNYGYTGNAQADYFITQAALWHEKAGFDVSAGSIVVSSSVAGAKVTNPGKNSPAQMGETIDAQLLAKCIDNLISTARDNPFQEGGSLHFYAEDGTRYDDTSKAPQKATNSPASDSSIPAGYLATQWLTLDCPKINWIYPDGISVSFEQNAIGAKVQDRNGTTYDSMPISQNGTAFRILVPDTMSDSDTVAFAAKGKVTTWKSCMSTPSSSEYQNLYVVWKAHTDSYVAGTVTQSIPYNANGTVQIKKTDEDGKPLAGATFSLESDTGIKLAQTTKADGLAVWKNLDPGTYTIKETKAPDGYEISSQTWTATVAADGTVTPDINTLVCVNKKTGGNTTSYGKVKIHKVDDKGKSLANAEFTLRNKAGTYSEVRTTDVNGYAEWTSIPVAVPTVSNGTENGTTSGGGNYNGNTTITTPVPPGANDYILTETKAPDGYQLLNDVKSFTLASGSSNEYTYEIENKPLKKYGWVDLTKIDPAHVKLEGVEFAVINKVTGETVQTGKTDWRGYLKFDNLPYDPEGTTYILKETKPLDGYASLPNDTEFTLKDGNASFTWTIENNKKYYQGSVTVIKKDADNQVPLAGAVITLFDSAGKQIGIKTTGADGKVIFDNLDLGEYYYQETQAPNGYRLDSNKYKLEITERHLDAESILPNKKYGAVDIYKVDYDKYVPLEGVKFGIYDKDKNLLKEGLTNGNGHVIFDDLEIGTYYIKELEALPGYQIDDTYHLVTLSDSVRYYQQTVTNKKYGSITLHKTDDVGNPLEGAYFQLYDKDMKPVGEPKKSQGNGKIIWDHLELGQYYIKETQAPDGYQIGQFTKGIEITERHRDEEITISNQIIYGSVTIVKTNENNHALRGAEFAIYNDQNVELERKKTTTNGTVIFEHLPVGYYTIQEINPPVGYIPIKEDVSVPGDEIMDVEITMRHLDQQIYIANKPIVGNVHIIKKDSVDKHKLGGAIFALYDDKGHEIASAKTDDWGEAWFKNIKFGKYTMKEVASPIGYEQNDTVYDVNITKDGETLEYEIENKPITYRIQLHKDDGETSKPLEGAEFQLWQNGAPLSYNGTTTFTTDKDGIIKFPFDLTYGEYQLVETKAPYGYIASDAINVWLNETTTYTKDDLQNRVVDITAHNQSKRTVLKLTKVDEDTGLPLQNAKFEVWNEDRTECVAKGETGPTGIVVFDLKLGTYWYREVEAPEGYTVDTTWRQVVFEDTSYGLTQSFRVTNKSSNYAPPSGGNNTSKDEFPSIEITKLDISTGEVLPNAGFVIYAEDGVTVVKRGVTDETGIVKFQLNKGTFYYQEFMAPNGYDIDNTKYKFTLDENNQILKCEMTNHKSDTPNKPDTPGTPDIPGTPNKPDVPGTPDTPDTPNTPQGELWISKADISTGALLPNATFFIYGSDQKTVIVSGVTDETGIAKFKLSPGDYYYQEFSAPDGYEVDNSKFPFSIKENGDIVKCRMTDVPKTNNNLPNTSDVLRDNNLVIYGAGTVLILATAVFVLSRLSSRRRRF